MKINSEPEKHDTLDETDYTQNGTKPNSLQLCDSDNQKRSLGFFCWFFLFIVSNNCPV